MLLGLRLTRQKANAVIKEYVEVVEVEMLNQCRCVTILINGLQIYSQLWNDVTSNLKTTIKSVLHYCSLNFAFGWRRFAFNDWYFLYLKRSFYSPDTFLNRCKIQKKPFSHSFKILLVQRFETHHWNAYGIEPYHINIL